ncbi:MAG: LptF/LptG family permease [Planctomycetaceae bacterium]
MRWPVPLLQRYIFWEILRVFIFVVTCQTGLLIFVGVIQHASEQGLGPAQIMEVLPYIGPSMLPFTIPAALLLTVCVVYGRIAGDQEVIAAKAAGISVMSLMWPAFLLGGVLSVASLLLTDQVIPWAMGNIERIVITAMEDVFLDRLRSDHQYRDPRRGIDVTVHGLKGRKLLQPVFRYRRSNGSTATIQAESAEIELDLANHQAILHLENAFIDVPPKVAVYIAGKHFEAIEWTPAHESTNARHLPIQEIEQERGDLVADRLALEDRRAIEIAFALSTGDFHALAPAPETTGRRIQETTSRTTRLTCEIHSRFALACSCFFFTLVGCPFSILKAKSQFLTSFLYCFVPIVTGYYPLVLTMMVQARTGRIPATWPMWIGNGVLSLFAMFIVRRVMRN